jgi:hypothetical protein
LPPAPPQRQFFCLVQAIGLLAIDHQALPAQQRVQPQIAEPPVLPGKLA